MFKRTSTPIIPAPKRTARRRIIGAALIGGAALAGYRIQKSMRRDHAAEQGDRPFRSPQNVGRI